MTQREKAIEIMNLFQRNFEFFHTNEDGNTQFSVGKLTHPQQKELALIYVDGRMAQLESLLKPEYVSFRLEWEGEINGIANGYEVISFWKHVKKEIELL